MDIRNAISRRRNHGTLQPHVTSTKVWIQIVTNRDPHSWSVLTRSTRWFKLKPKTNARAINRNV